MSVRSAALMAGLLLLALAACSRRPPAPEAAPAAVVSDSAAAPVELAGGPPSSDGPAEPSLATPAAPADVDAIDQPEDSAPARDAPPAEAAPANSSDPLEPVNRRLYAVNGAIGRVIDRAPRIAPSEGRPAHVVVRAARNALRNLDEPSVAANDLLQRKLGRAVKSVARFVINSTAGLAGLMDVAGRLGLKHHDNDADRTLQAYGAPAGPYLYLPIVGPTTLRAVAGAAVEGYLYPPHWLHLATAASTALRGVGYAKLAQMAIVHADRAAQSHGRDGYIRARREYFASRVAHTPAPPASAQPRPTELAYVTSR